MGGGEKSPLRNPGFELRLGKEKDEQKESAML